MVTPDRPGAVGVVQIVGHGAPMILRGLTGIDQWPLSRVILADLSGIDRGLAVCLSDHWAQVMPHGGPRVIRRVVDRLVEIGAVFEPDPSPSDTYVEARTALEADMLAAVARAASPAAIDLLMAQPMLWRLWVSQHLGVGHSDTGARAFSQIMVRSDPLDRLIEPASVVVVGRPNVGKSTLTNWVLGRSASVVADLPGTTRDWVGGLACLLGQVAVRWVDTPGLRVSDDEVERQAVELATRVIQQADVLIVMRDPLIDWPDSVVLGRRPDLWVINKIDQAGPWVSGSGGQAHKPLAISATSGLGLERLQAAVLGQLGLARLEPAPLWAFSATLRSAMTCNCVDQLTAYVGLSA